jgi:hypothetical protein
MNGVLDLIILIAMVLDEGTRQSATYRIEMVAHHHDEPTSYLDTSTTHPFQGQILHKEYLQRKIMGQVQTWDLAIFMFRVLPVYGTTFIHHDLRRITACPVFLVDTWLGRTGLVGLSLRGRRRRGVDRVRLVL